jgi:acyl-homoserine-lactone acylase
MFKYGALSLLLCLLSACTFSPETEPAKSDYKTQIRWTSYGIPHVKADDWAGLGYGFAYATAVDAVCVIAHTIMISNGDSSRFNGPENGNLERDVFYRGMLTDERVAAYFAAQSTNDHQFSVGYAAGYNRYLRDHRDSLPASCAGKPWIRNITKEDLFRVNMGFSVIYGLGRFDKDIFAANPPDEQTASIDTPINTMLDSRYGSVAGIGSNAIALGSAVSESGRGVLFGNPHYPWKGAARFHMIHTTIPGELDVMGSSLVITPRVVIGFNKDIAWTHTVSTATRFTLFKLQLNPENPMEYRYGDSFKPIKKTVVHVQVVGADDNLSIHKQDIFSSHYGPVVMNQALPWNNETAYTIRDVNLENTRSVASWEAMNIAKSVADIEAAISMQGMAFVNTIAADRHGSAFYADISATPNIDADLLARCRIAVEHMPARVIVLNGSEPDCEWKDDPRSRVPGAMPADDMPRIHRKNYVTNSNDSYWLANPQAPLEGYSPSIGPEGTARTLRTRAGLNFIEQRLAEKEKLGPQDLQDIIYSQRNFAAEILLNDVLELCEQITAPVSLDQSDVNIGPACAALRNWDRRQNNDSRGAQVWTEFWRTAQNIPDLYAVAFDINDPVHTPDGIAIDDAAVAQAVAVALGQAQLTLENAGIALDARWGDVQFAERNGERIGIPGGQGWAGMFSMIEADLQKDQGYTPIIHGNSYMQVISWDKDGKLDARGMLTYSQSQQPESRHYDDLTRLYSEGQWIRFPFSDDEIQADPELRILELSE